MKNQIQKTLVKRLSGFKGQHAQIARDCGLAQATISRISRNEVSPTLTVAEPILDWMDKQDRKLAKKAA